jgi:hypothetical protein
VAHVAADLGFIERPADFTFFGGKGDIAAFINNPYILDPLKRAHLLDHFIGPFPVILQHFIMSCFYDCFTQFVCVGDRRFQEHGPEGGDIDVCKKHHEDKQDETDSYGQFGNKADAQAFCSPSSDVSSVLSAGNE